MADNPDPRLYHHGYILNEIWLDGGNNKVYGRFTIQTEPQKHRLLEASTLEVLIRAFRMAADEEAARAKREAEEATAAQANDDSWRDYTEEYIDQVEADHEELRAKLSPVGLSTATRAGLIDTLDRMGENIHHAKEEWVTAKKTHGKEIAEWKEYGEYLQGKVNTLKKHKNVEHLLKLHEERNAKQASSIKTLMSTLEEKYATRARLLVQLEATKDTLRGIRSQMTWLQPPPPLDLKDKLQLAINELHQCLSDHGRPCGKDSICEETS